MKKLIAVFGINGAGKTTLVKNFLLSDSIEDDGEGLLFDCYDFYERKNQFGTYTVSKGGKIVAVGKYSIKCGGADSIKTVEDYFNMIDFLAENYPEATLCVEGVLQRAIGDLTECYEKFLQRGYEVNLIKLDVSLDKAVERVKNRNGRMPNVDCIKAKIKNTGRLFEKLQETEKFNWAVIDTENKTPEEVYTTFRKAIGD